MSKVDPTLRIHKTHVGREGERKKSEASGRTMIPKK